QVFVDQAGQGGADEIRRMFADYVRGTVELDYDRYLAHVGYRLERKRDPLGPRIGATTQAGGGAVRVRSVMHDGPGDRGGLADGDVIRAIDGQLIRDERDYARALSACTLGEVHTFTIERTGRTL